MWLEAWDWMKGLWIRVRIGLLGFGRGIGLFFFLFLFFVVVGGGGGGFQKKGCRLR